MRSMIKSPYTELKAYSNYFKALVSACVYLGGRRHWLSVLFPQIMPLSSSDYNENLGDPLTASSHHSYPTFHQDLSCTSLKYFLPLHGLVHSIYTLILGLISSCLDYCRTLLAGSQIQLSPSVNLS